MNTQAFDVLEVMDRDSVDADFSRKSSGSPYRSALKADSKAAQRAVSDLIKAGYEALALLEAEDFSGYKSVKDLREALELCSGENP